MNWKRGLLRLWVVGAVLWVIGVGILTRPDQPIAVLAKPWFYAPPSDPHERFMEDALRGADVANAWEELDAMWPIVFLPPALSLIAAVGLMWALRGFNKPPISN